MNIIEVYIVKEVPFNSFVLEHPIFEIINIEAIKDFIKYNEKKEIYGDYKKAFLLRSECKLFMYPSAQTRAKNLTMYRLLQSGETIAPGDQIKTITTNWKDAHNHIGDKAEADEIRRPLEYFIVDANTTDPFKHEIKCAVYLDARTRSQIIRASKLLKDFPEATISFGFNTGRFFEDENDEVTELCETSFDALQYCVLSVEIRVSLEHFLIVGYDDNSQEFFSEPVEIY